MVGIKEEQLPAVVSLILTPIPLTIPSFPTEAKSPVHQNRTSLKLQSNMLSTNTALLATAALLLPATLANPVSCTGYQASPSDIAQCADFLTSLGSQACETYGGTSTVFCERGDAQIVVVGTGRVGVKTSSPW
jgi:hypothetical protein